ncbi:MAG: 30S ribosomal protein S20 [Caldilineaceae bacterium]|nr:30S ribosomal protein S20 [Caldilineaceae bacterium]
MANIKSAEKRARQNDKRRERNRILRSSARTAVKKCHAAIAAGDQDAAAEAVFTAGRALDKAAGKGAIHANNAARRRSRITLAYNRAFGDAE